MLIVSNFRDYYDSALGVTGVDKACVFRRYTKEEEVVLPTQRGPHEADSEYLDCVRTPDKSSTAQTRLVGFCGEICPAVEVQRWDTDSQELKTQNLYEWQAAFDAIQEHGISRYSWMWNKQWVKSFFSYDWSRYKKTFEERGVPLFLIDGKHFHTSRWLPKKRYSIILNPCMKELGFMQIKDPYSCFQEIHMFLSGILGAQEKDIVEVGNDDRVKARGFDEWSFRKEPTKRKKK